MLIVNNTATRETRDLITMVSINGVGIAQVASIIMQVFNTVFSQCI
mgnify:FL=1